MDQNNNKVIASYIFLEYFSKCYALWNISDTNNPKIQSRSDGGKLRFKGPGLYMLEKKKDKKKMVLKNVNNRD